MFVQANGEIFVDAWLNSAGHRPRVIQNPHLTSDNQVRVVGIGAVAGGGITFKSGISNEIYTFDAFFLGLMN